MKHTLLIFATALLLGIQSHAQTGVAINPTGAEADSCAMLDVSSTTKGLLVPRMTEAQRTDIVRPVKGLLVYQIDGTQGFYYYNGTGWTNLSLVNFTESNYTYDSKTGVKFTPNNAATNVDIVLETKGTGGILAQQPDGTATGGNKRGNFAVDLQMDRSTATQVASGVLSAIVGGYGNTATGGTSTAMGAYNTATGESSTAMGIWTTASGNGSTAMGLYSNASGVYSSAMGAYTKAPSAYETVIGRYNTNYTPATTTGWDNSDRLFVVGNGTSGGSRSNAFTILKNACATIGGSLTLNENGANTSYLFPETRGTSGQVLQTNGSGNTSWETPAISPATTSAPGSMSAADKTKLDAQTTGTAAGQMQYWNGTSWVTVAAGTFGQTLEFRNGAPVWVDKNINILSIGDTYKGGIIAYFLQSGDPGYDANIRHGLIAAPTDQNSNAVWGCYGTNLTGADGFALGTGAQNTIDIVAGCNAPGIAARICNDLVLNGYDDWYLPSSFELSKLYQNRVAIGGFALDQYWSSTEYNSGLALRHTFTDGDQDTNYKSTPLSVRAVRDF